MKKHFIIIISLISIVFPLSAQNSKDVLYLKSDSLVYGDRYEIPQYDGRKKSGLGFSLEAGVMAGAQNSDYRTPFSFNFLINATSKTRNIFGLGSGVEFFGESFTPLFLEYKYLFSEKKTSQFFFMRGGELFHLNGDIQHTDYTNPQFDVEKKYHGGGSFTIGTGISWSKDDSETYLTFAYRNAHTSYSQKNYNNQTATYRNSYNRLEIKFGFKF
jgi:hypothetical protein